MLSAEVRFRESEQTRVPRHAQPVQYVPSLCLEIVESAEVDALCSRGLSAAQVMQENTTSYLLSGFPRTDWFECPSPKMASVWSVTGLLWMNDCEHISEQHLSKVLLLSFLSGSSWTKGGSRAQKCLLTVLEGSEPSDPKAWRKEKGGETWS